MNAYKESTYYSNTREEVALFLPKSAKHVLEIGCAAGVFRQFLPVSCTYWGVEFDHDAANVAERVLDKVLKGTFDDVYEQLPDGFFDTVICNDVIEHMPDHDDFFKKIKAKMSVDGKIYGSIPNVRHVENLKSLIFKKDWEYRDEGVLDRTHLRFFTFKSLKRSLLEHGFTIDTYQGINSSLPKKWYRIGTHSLIRHLLVLLFGSDTQYLQIYFIAART